eukprot:CAMPEP_0201692386 /NCGR_PEP_ID=MMETSP0578-20130828/5287_1 /ASSEMBLY_ACC=CAM_ASM_000663 /TAXON_ID=267565 /ORGANISM="Skeletonema grethea, Strain CCMP 1804" /LENGTH=643 /DNA_ID=CAMNT_0048177747 /DNA_START=90 /DNA_END=2021 /DNA_ORIENTATION=+
MPTQVISVKFFVVALGAASLVKQTRNQLSSSQYHYFAEAVDAPVSPSSAPKDGTDSSSRLQRQKNRPTKRQAPPQKQQEQQQNGEQQINLQEKQQMKHVTHHTAKSEYDAYMHWCEAVLGIRSVVEIKEIEYVDHLQILWKENENEALYDSPNEFQWLQQYSQNSGSLHEHLDEKYSAKSQTQPELPIKMVRGLVAKHDVSVGDIVISIPLYSLLSVPSTIDHDPVLSRILGPTAREQYGWTDTLEYEVPLLVIAILYHRSLGMESPLSHYIDVLSGTPTDFPFLWSNQKLRDNTDKIGEGVKKLARGIQKDLREMYDRIMGKLVTEHSDLFAPLNGDLEGWMYSYKNFQWAFALVISRHHYLPIQDLDDRKVQLEQASEHEVGQTTAKHIIETTQSDSTVLEVVPPANQPTDSWVDLAMNEEKVVEDQDKGISADDGDDDMIAPSGFFKHSFLAPLADMINFGPPCLTGSYNPDEHVFELIATCPFKAGQEVTFYYSSECADVIIANYAFIHPLVPPCTTLDEVKEKSEEWKIQAMDAKKKLWKAHHQVEVLMGEVLALESQLQSCESREDKVSETQIHSVSASNEKNKSAGDEASSDNGTTPSHQKLRKDSSSRNHEVGVRGRMHESSQEEFDEQIMEELG